MSCVRLRAAQTDPGRAFSLSVGEDIVKTEKGREGQRRAEVANDPDQGVARPAGMRTPRAVRAGCSVTSRVSQLQLYPASIPHGPDCCQSNPWVKRTRIPAAGMV